MNAETVPMTIGEIADNLIACGCRVPKATIVDLFATARKSGAADAKQYALLSRLDAEKVTRAEVLATIRKADDEWMAAPSQSRTADGLYKTREDYEADAILSIIPAQETRAEVVEECARVADAEIDKRRLHLGKSNIANMEANIAAEIAHTIRALKASPPQEPDDHMLSGIAEVYQVVGVLADKAGVFSDPQVIKVMDWLADPKGDLDVLPFGLPEQEPQAQSSKDLHDDVLATISKYCWRTPENNLVIEDAAGLAHEVIAMCSSQEPQGWLPIESAPKDGTHFLAYEKIRLSKFYECWWQADLNIGGYWQDDYDSEPAPTNWQPLPTPPT